MVVLVEFYSMADSSTTARRIPILFAGGYWAASQLHNGIGYVPTPLKLMKLLSSVEVVPGRNSTQWLIPPQPMLGFRFCFLEVFGLVAGYPPV